MTTLTRFFDKIELVPETKCWKWTGTKYGPNPNFPYAFFWSPEKKDMVRAHRYIYEKYVSKIPDGYQIDHICKNTLCVNPEHLRHVTPWVNQLNSNSIPILNMLKTHCIRGHEFTEGNTIRLRSSRNPSLTIRRCYICKKERDRNDKRKKAFALRKNKQK